MLSEYATLANVSDVLMSMETYQANSMDGWLHSDQYGGDYIALIRAAGVAKTSPGFACSHGSGSFSANATEQALWNGTLCGQNPCWTDSPVSWEQRLQRMKRDGVREASIFMLNHRQGTWPCPVDESFWEQLHKFVSVENSTSLG
eukprot:SAG31_NODE_868_length_11355_cov_4.658582_4_plen_145_part_00